MYWVKNTWTNEGLSTVHQSGLVWGLLVGGSEIAVYTAVSYFFPIEYMYIVVQFYPWFKFYCLLFLGMVMFDNEFETKENKT